MSVMYCSNFVILASASWSMACPLAIDAATFDGPCGALIGSWEGGRGSPFSLPEKCWRSFFDLLSADLARTQARVFATDFSSFSSSLALR